MATVRQLPRPERIAAVWSVVSGMEAAGARLDNTRWLVLAAELTDEGHTDVWGGLIADVTARHSEDTIAQLYAEARAALASADEARYRNVMSQLRELQDQQARRMEEAFKAGRILQPEALADALSAADALLAKHENPAG